ncbi:MAG: hypothetical protein H7Y02_00620 [Candidatus Obscuribacterales bacterium]|nr:hypothetical protein [Steroidobacteraceae bacterium]
MSATMPISRTQTFVWLIRRELWEHRALYIAPLIFGAVVILGVLYAAVFHGTIEGINMQLDGSITESLPGGRRYVVYLAFAIPFALITAVVASYYALDALYAERRDRSVLFWKALPISDLETIMSKLAVAALVAPAIAVVVALATLLVVFIVASVVLAANGHEFVSLWKDVPVLQNFLLLIYITIVLALWHLPLLAWLLLASSWARRAAFLWASIPIGVLVLLENRTLGTNYISEQILIRIAGAVPLATNLAEDFTRESSLPLEGRTFVDIIEPGAFLSSLQLWVGLLMAAVFIAAAVWVRRYREAD